MHLLYGLAGSGKTTLARRLAADGRALRLTLDEWMIRLHPGLDLTSPDYGRRADDVREVMWSAAEQALAAGVDVVLDWNAWSRERRRWAVSRPEAAGASVVLHRLSTTLEVATARALDRERSGAAYAHPVTPEGNTHLAGLMQEPDPAEGLEIIDH